MIQPKIHDIIGFQLSINLPNYAAFNSRTIRLRYVLVLHFQKIEKKKRIFLQIQYPVIIELIFLTHDYTNKLSTKGSSR